jgi:hypothetical protein
MTKKDDYHKLARSLPSSELSRTLTAPAQVDLLTGEGSIINEDFKLFIKGYNELPQGVKQSAAKLLDALMITATEEGLQDTLVRLPLKRFMSMLGLTDEKEARTQVKLNIDALERISFLYRGTGKSRGEWLKVSIAGGTVGQIKNGDIIFRFNQDYFDSYKAGNFRYMFMYFPREALQGSIRANPWKYYLGRKISEHKSINRWKDNQDIIGVDTLIKACPGYTTYEDVMKGSGNVKDRIIEPFERDMTALSPTITWEYQGGERPAGYHEFMAANVVIHWSGYPVSARRVESAEERAARLLTEKDSPAQISIFDELTLDQLAQLFDSRDTAEEISNNARSKHPDIDVAKLITENIEYAKGKQGSVKNFRGYLRKAIENDYAGYKTRLKKEAEEQLKMEERKLRAEHAAKLAELAELERQQEFERNEKERMEKLSRQLKQANVTELPEIWQKSINIMKKECPEGDIWFANGTQLFADRENNVFLVAPHSFAVDQINNNYLNVLRIAISENYPKTATIKVITNEAIVGRFFQAENQEKNKPQDRKQAYKRQNK